VIDDDFMALFLLPLSQSNSKIILSNKFIKMHEEVDAYFDDTLDGLRSTKTQSA
jgi:hypothetical protein